MKKILIISSFFLVLIAMSTIGYQIISANVEVNEIQDEIVRQTEQETYLTPYGYTLDNPNLILNPYDISPLTAILLFETAVEEVVTITIEGKDENSTYTNTFEAETKHYIPIYGLYPNSTNIIHVKCGTKTKKIEIKTEPLPEDLKPKTIDNDTNKLNFVTSDNYPYALDNNNEVRWYLTKNYSKKISQLQNGNLLLSADTLNQNKQPTGLVEINFLGKITKQYNIDNGYYGSYVETENSLFVLSNSLLEIDKQTGTILKTYPLDQSYDQVSYDQETNTVIVSNQSSSLSINIKTKETTSDFLNKIKPTNESEIVLPLYYDQKNYKIIKGVKFSTNQKTKESEKNIFLVGYKKIDENYKKHKITITKTEDNIEINGIFESTEEVYIILDKFLDKKIYDIKGNQTIINKEGLDGKYSIYIKINNTIYKTNTYINF